jgi:hypothetical protein
MRLHCGHRQQRGPMVRMRIARAPYIDSRLEALVTQCSARYPHPGQALQSLCCVPLGSNVGCASEKNIGCAHRKARVRFVCCARKWLCSLPGGPLAVAAAAAWQYRPRLQCCCRCCPLRYCAAGGASAGGAGFVCTCFIGKSVLAVSQNFVLKF